MSPMGEMVSPMGEGRDEVVPPGRPSLGLQSSARHVRSRSEETSRKPSPTVVVVANPMRSACHRCSRGFRPNVNWRSRVNRVHAKFSVGAPVFCCTCQCTNAFAALRAIRARAVPATPAENGAQVGSVRRAPRRPSQPGRCSGCSAKRPKRTTVSAVARSRSLASARCIQRMKASP